MESNNVSEVVSHLFRQQSGKMAATLVKLFGFDNLNLVEDVIQDTFLTAYKEWPFKMPDKPEAWLMTVARNNAINAVKKGARIKSIDQTVFIRTEEAIADHNINLAFGEQQITDSQLKLLFLCCHPDLPEKSQIILTLKVLCGFSLEEIANGMFLQKEAVKKTLYRAKLAIRESGLHNETNYVLFSPERTALVLQVLYLMFNEGYKTTEHDNLIQYDLCFEAIRLGKLLLSVKPNTEADALMALMFFNIARFPSRMDDNGDIILLEAQDRDKWDKRFIEEGFRYLQSSRKSTVLSRYHLEAGIASLHSIAATYVETDWQTIVYYYDQIIQLDSSPIIEMHRAFAIAQLEGSAVGLQLLDAIDKPELQDYYLYHAMKGNLLYKACAYGKARQAFEKAAAITNSERTKKFLKVQADNCLSHIN